MKYQKEYHSIYPLTIINMRLGNKYVAFNCEDDVGFVSSVQGDEEVSYDLEAWMKKNVHPCPYGIGVTIFDALDNLVESMKNKET